MAEKLCIFCKNFNWSAEEMWGMGSTMTGPMFEGGDGRCAAGMYEAKALKKMGFKDDSTTRPHDEQDYRAMILIAQKCDKYEQIDP
jgi:hypothetical protein